MRILILEDDPFIALDLQAIVEGEGHSATVCASVAEARRRLAEGVDFAFLDIDVRDGKSYDLATSIGDRRVPFTFVSGSRRDELPVHLREARFIAKPFTQAAIVASLPAFRPAPIGRSSASLQPAFRHAS